ncbi:hypothetical protein, partial [Streptococcus pneumoniae]|uniref:hypothetical protein n=1 Tax=Streptococcus pneumoniae TaxID=1313 RepID=UPI0009916F7C
SGDFSIDFVIGQLPSYSKYRFEAADKTDEITLILNENQKALYNSDMKSTKEEIQTIKTLLKDSRTVKYHKRLQIVL